MSFELNSFGSYLKLTQADYLQLEIHIELDFQQVIFTKII